MKRTDIGGQAVVEGVMMRSEKGTALVVRRSDGSLAKEFHHQRTRYKKGSFPTWPVVRGVYAFFKALSDGMSITTRAAEIFGEEETEPSKFEKWLAKRFDKSAMDIVKWTAVVLAVILAIGLFFLLPIGVISLLELAFGKMSPVLSAIVQGLIRLVIFLVYLYAISGIRDIRRVFMYHGAEHKTIACYEAELPMTPENAQKCTRLHPRCGTNYLFLTMAVSIIVTTVVSALCTLIPGFTAWHDASGLNSFLFRLARIVLILPIAGISYEVLKAAAKHDNLVCRIARAPGLALQHLTTKEPTGDMLEVAIASFELALHPPKGDLEFDTKANAPELDRKIEPEEIPEPEPTEEQTEDAETAVDEAPDADAGEGGDE
ncbi:MAG: DUF1385 domain-containing protein [Clostridia bacterium]|nr:DUF1385 domain-containing protein [Clostridia bacterium]